MRIEWVDAQTTDEWNPWTAGKFRQLPHCFSVGFLTDGPEGCMSLTALIDIKNEIEAQVIDIPIGWIKAVHKLNVGAKIVPKSPTTLAKPRKTK